MPCKTIHEPTRNERTLRAYFVDRSFSGAKQDETNFGSPPFVECLTRSLLLPVLYRVNHSRAGMVIEFKRDSASRL
jgi:hypothetical protein